MASIASCAPGGADEVDAPDQAPLPDLIHSMMLVRQSQHKHIFSISMVLVWHWSHVPDFPHAFS